MKAQANGGVCGNKRRFCRKGPFAGNYRRKPPGFWNSRLIAKRRTTRQCASATRATRISAPVCPGSHGRL